MLEILVLALLSTAASSGTSVPGVDLVREDSSARMRALLEALRDGQEPAEALRGMRRIHFETKQDRGRVLRHLRKYLSEDADLELAARFALLGDESQASPEEWSTLARHESAALRETAIWLCGVAGTESSDVTAALLDALSDADPAVRLTAVWAVGARAGVLGMQAGEYVPGAPSGAGVVAIGGGGAGSAYLVLHVGEPLRWFRSPMASWEDAVSWLDDGERLHTTPAADAELGPELRSAAPALCGLLLDDDERIVEVAFECLDTAAPGAGDRVADLCRQAQGEDDEVRHRALHTLARMGAASKSSVDQVEDLAEGGVSGGALSVLFNNGASSAVRLALAALAGDDKAALLESVSILGHVEPLPSDALDALETSFLRPNYLAAAVLLRYGERSVPTFLRGLDHELVDVRGVSLMALARLGPRASAALERVKELQNDSDRWIAQAAKETVAAIR